MEIKSSLLKEKEFDYVRKSIEEVSAIDNEQDFRVRLIEYINDTADNDEDMFFYDMLPYARFLDPSAKEIAFTTPSRLIYLNSPGIIGKNYRKWDFTYDHECLHQLWDTFGVAEKIKAAGIEYNHYILNVASDCVINDYLYYYRKKEIPDNIITPEYIKEHFDVEYDHKTDTQYTLYLKLIEKKDIIEKDELCKGIHGKIKPKSVDKQQGPPPPPPPPPGKHSKDYINGWTDAIKDVVDKKVDPTDKNYKPKSSGNDEYDAGYNDCMDNIKDGLERGIAVNDNPPKEPSQGSDLPQIPWDTGENDKQSSNSSSDDEGDSGSSGSLDDAQESADNAKNSADAAQKAADAAQKAAEKGSGEKSDSELQDAADKAQDAADKAADAAKKAQEAADAAEEAKKKGDSKGAEKAAKEAADAAKEAADAAREAADAARETGDSDAKKAADNADKTADNSENQNNNSNKGKSGDKSQKAGTGHIVGSESPEDLERIKKEIEDIIKDYSNKLAGTFGEFISKCRSSVKLDKGGLNIDVQKGVRGWDVQLDKRINKFVKQKVFQKKRQYEQTYSRIKRGTGYVKMGEPLKPGRRVKEQTMVLNAAFYIDRSGSMGSALETVFDAAYKMCETLKKKYCKESVIEDFVFKMLSFDDYITPVKYGNKISLGGGTMPMSKLLQSIENYSNDFLLNIVITDGYFDINETEVKKFIKNVKGIVIYVVNRDFPEMEKLAKELNTKLFFIKASSDFELD